MCMCDMSKNLIWLIHQTELLSYHTSWNVYSSHIAVVYNILVLFKVCMSIYIIQNFITIANIVRLDYKLIIYITFLHFNFSSVVVMGLTLPRSKDSSLLLVKGSGFYSTECCWFVAVMFPCSKVCPRYLHTNSTSHTGPFSAIAELIGESPIIQLAMINQHFNQFIWPSETLLNLYGFLSITCSVCYMQTFDPLKFLYHELKLKSVSVWLF